MGEKDKTMSVLFADIAENGRLQEKLGKAEALYAIERCFKRMQRAVDGSHGRITRSMDGELMALFDSAEDACQAAIEIQQRVTDLPPVSGIKLTIRIGIQYGQVNEEGEEIHGVSVDQAVSLARLAQAEQSLINEQTRTMLPPVLQAATRRLDDFSVSGHNAIAIFELLWRTSERRPESLVQRSEQLAVKSRHGHLSVRYANAVIMLNELRPKLSIGREVTCDLAIHDQRASRSHARIERRGTEFVLVDASTNGTFLTLVGEPERWLRREEAVLRNKGIICFAAPAQSPDADIAEFECI